MTWMDFEGIVPGDVGLPEKDKYCIISLTCEILKKKKKPLIETEIRFMVAGAEGRGRGIGQMS